MLEFYKYLFKIAIWLIPSWVLVVGITSYIYTGSFWEFWK